MNFQKVHKRLSWALHVAMLTAVLGLSAFAPMLATAQVNPEIANCEEIKDGATSTQAEICSAHPGCRLVFAVQRTCVRAKKFLSNLQDAIGEGTKSLFGTRKEVTPEAVFQASLPETARSVKSVVDNKDPASSPVKDAISTISQAIRGNGPALTGQTPKGEPFVYYGDAKNGKAEGAGTFIDADGRVQRGIFKDGGFDQGVKVTKDGDVYNGSFSSDNLQNGKWIRPNGTSFEGEFKFGSRQNGREYDSTGKLVEEGRYESDKLYVGKQYDPDGRAVEIDKVKDQRIVALAAKEEADRRTRKIEDERRQAEQRRTEELQQAEKLKAEERARSAARFQDELKTMNPGQLYAKADELRERGDKAGAEEASRALIRRFPDHALVDLVTKQMLAGSQGKPQSNIVALQKQQNTVVQKGEFKPILIYKQTDCRGVVGPCGDPGRLATPEELVRLGYSADANNPGKTTGTNSARGSDDSQCEQQRAAFEQRLVPINARIANLKGMVENLSAAMWVLSEAIKMGDTFCSNSPKYKSERASYQQSYDSAAKSCSQVSASGGCSPRAP